MTLMPNSSPASIIACRSSSARPQRDVGVAVRNPDGVVERPQHDRVAHHFAVVVADQAVTAIADAHHRHVAAAQVVEEGVRVGPLELGLAFETDVPQGHVFEQRAVVFVRRAAVDHREIHVVVNAPLLAARGDGSVPVRRAPIHRPHVLALFRVQRAGVEDLAQARDPAVTHLDEGDEPEIDAVARAVEFAAGADDLGAVNAFEMPALAVFEGNPNFGLDIAARIRDHAQLGFEPLSAAQRRIQRGSLEHAVFGKQRRHRDVIAAGEGFAIGLESLRRGHWVRLTGSSRRPSGGRCGCRRRC